MVSFDATTDGTSVTTWSADGRLDTAPTLELEAVSSLLVIAPHPDDETLGAGGFIAECGRLGIPVRVVVVTDGSASDPSAEPDALATVRAGEVREAVQLLDPEASIELLGFADGHAREQRDDIRNRLEPFFSGLLEGALVLAPWRGDGHRDHRVIAEESVALAARVGAQLLEYPIWMWHWGSPSNTEIPWDRFVVRRQRDDITSTKSAAIGAHRSQLGQVLRPSFVRHFDAGREVFIRGEAPGVDVSYFDDMYARHEDPWGFDSRWYERRKRELVVASLPREHYGRVLEIGCSTGALTAEFARRSDAVLAVDVSAAAVDRARRRLKDSPNVTVELLDVASVFPAGPFDLIVLSEVGYYFDRETLVRVLGDILDHLAVDGTLLACHWLHPVAEYPLDGEAVHAAIDALPSLTRLVEHREADFILEVLSLDGRSVATHEGLVQ